MTFKQKRGVQGNQLRLCRLPALLPALASCQAPAVLKPGCVLNRPRDPASTWHEKLRDRVPGPERIAFPGRGPLGT